LQSIVPSGVIGIWNSFLLFFYPPVRTGGLRRGYRHAGSAQHVGFRFARRRTGQALLGCLDNFVLKSCPLGAIGVLKSKITPLFFSSVTRSLIYCKKSILNIFKYHALK